MDLKKYLHELQHLTEQYETIESHKNSNNLVNGDTNLELGYEIYLNKYEKSLKLRFLDMLLRDVLNSNGYSKMLTDLSIQNFLGLLNIENGKLESDLENLQKLINCYSTHLNS